MSEQLNKTYRTVQSETGPENYYTYRWGDVAISEYATVNFRGVSYLFETADNPFNGDVPGEHPQAVATLSCPSTRLEDGELEPMGDDGHAFCEYWSRRTPGHVDFIEVTDTGELFAFVWDGTVELVNHDNWRAVADTPQSLLADWRNVILQLNGASSWASLRTRMIGPVGTVADLTDIRMYDPTPRDRNPFESDMPDWLRDDTTQDDDVWGNFIDGLDLE